MTHTPIDLALMDIEESGGDESAWRSFYATFTATELVLALSEAPRGDRISPRTIGVDGEALALAFDTEARLAEFAPEGADHVSLSGRRLASLLSGQGLALGLNLGLDVPGTVLPAEAMAWLSETLAEAPQMHEVVPERLTPPRGVTDALLSLIDARLAMLQGVAACAYLAGGGREGELILAIEDLPAHMHDAAAAALGEALALGALPGVTLDIAFVDGDSDLARAFARTGLGFDLSVAEEAARPGPGTDPDTPPRLR